MNSTDTWEAVVIGSGFGGAVTSCRLARKWPGRVLVLERGKRYPMGSFPRTPHAMQRNFWSVPWERRRAPAGISREELHGMFDIRSYRGMDVVLGAGLGGGSLIYANVFMEPPDEVFDQRWPGTCKRAKLLPYYTVAREVLGARPIPVNDDPRRRIIRTGLFQEIAGRLGRDSRLVDIMVFFGNDHAAPLPIGHQERNRHGALQTSCVYCAECDIGCNYHAKNTVDLNYLFVAEHRHGAGIRTEHLADHVVPVNAAGEDDPEQRGEHGYRVYYRDLMDGNRVQWVRAKRVIVSAGTLGSTELLLRCREAFRTLPHISDKLGHSYSGNGDFLSLVIGGKAPADPNYGPVITQRIDFNLFQNFNGDHAFIMEDASFPALFAWLAEGLKPRILWKGNLWRAARDSFHRWIRGHTYGSMAFAFRDLLGRDLAYHNSSLLCMGLDRSNGVMSLNRHKELDLRWPVRDSRPLYDAIVAAARAFGRQAGAQSVFPIPTWWWPFRRNVTVHSLGGCIVSDSPAQGVTSAAPATFGQVHGYTGLYVADGALVPTSVGANPAATISALSEMVAEGITGIAPTPDL